MQCDGAFDAIVIGSGISGGWAAKELTEQGFKVAVLERGRMVKHQIDYHTANKENWQLPLNGQVSAKDRYRKPKQARTGYALNQDIKHWFVDDLKHPYQEQKRFDWIRGYHVGGRSITWGRQCLRLSDLDFAANKVDGYGIDWPIRYQDIAPWYDKVERFIGVMGETLSLPQLPDGPYLPAMPLNCVEKDLRHTLMAKFNRHLTIGRVAHLTTNSGFEGRAQCSYRNRCMRGCPTGSYFSANASTLPAAEKTGNLTLITDTIATEIVFDEKTGLAQGVKTVGTLNNKRKYYRARVIFCCASTVASTALLLQSTSKRFPNGLGNDSGVLGHYLMDHHFRVGATGIADKFSQRLDFGRRPVGFHIPRFRNVDKQEQAFVRGYGYQGYATRGDWRRGFKEIEFGQEYVESLFEPGPWRVTLIGFGECLPYKENKLTLDLNKRDNWGLPQIKFDCSFKSNEQLMREDMKRQAVEMLTAAGYTNVTPYDSGSAPGQAIHEMGTARMGLNPKDSVVNQNNQLHQVANVYVTDGAFMTSSGYQNPSLTYMAFTARAAHHAGKLLSTGVF